MSLPNRWKDFYSNVHDLLECEQVKKMHEFRHHHFVTCFEHSVFVSYIAFLLAKKLGVDEREAARAGLLHDFYLYDSEDKAQYRGFNCLYHPPLALKNALEVCDLSKNERNAIISHMWPMAKTMPKCGVAVVVNMADKCCATLEFFKIFHRMKMRKYVPSPGM